MGSNDDVRVEACVGVGFGGKGGQSDPGCEGALTTYADDHFSSSD
jgi:hypothetical protein